MPKSIRTIRPESIKLTLFFVPNESIKYNASIIGSLIGTGSMFNNASGKNYFNTCSVISDTCSLDDVFKMYFYCCFATYS